MTSLRGEVPGLADIGVGALASPHVVMPAAEAERIAGRFWGLDVRAERLASEKDDTFRLADTTGDKWVLKASNPAEPADEIDFEVSLMRHVLAADSGVPVPQILPARDGLPVVSVEDDAGQRRLVRIMTYCVGTPLDSVDCRPSEREQVGECLARLRQATRSFRHPAERRVLIWDVRNLPALRPLVSTIDDPDKREMLDAAISRFLPMVDSICRLRSHVLHNDFSQSNLIVEQGAEPFIRGVIDFGDAGHTAIAIDASTAMLNQLPADMTRDSADDVFGNARDVLRGYFRYADLDSDEVRLIPHLIMGRVVSRALITLSRAALMPDNSAYILRNTEQGWGQLEWFLSRTNEEVSAALL
ncbi:phosphotransferase [Saxibacter everestensis]|uniref:Hydroxylysine kinase n=1 Tax=Saxibacter everestensis TaxID=2909229 RepID=A0ABY8QT88_9MICO|nr:phosphotransferase [Brevibacteriaceae bacterium ZFBP1038]